MSLVPKKVVLTSSFQASRYCCGDLVLSRACAIGSCFRTELLVFKALVERRFGAAKNSMDFSAYTPWLGVRKLVLGTRFGLQGY